MQCPTVPVTTHLSPPKHESKFQYHTIKFTNTLFFVFFFFVFLKTTNNHES